MGHVENIAIGSAIIDGVQVTNTVKLFSMTSQQVSGPNPFEPIAVPRNYKATLRWSQMAAMVQTDLAGTAQIVMFLMQSAIRTSRTFEAAGQAHDLQWGIKQNKPLLMVASNVVAVGTPVNTVLSTTFKTAERNFDESIRDVSIVSKGAASNGILGWGVFYIATQADVTFDAYWNAEYTLEWLGGRGSPKPLGWINDEEQNQNDASG